MQYLTLWRMQLASEMLTVGDQSMAQIGARIGYESEAAFSRAFKRVVGMAPGEWRDQRARAA
jgi:AraC-like DNA-binding protein